MPEEIDKKSARKYWWILMLIPIGLIIGTITSLIQHLRKDQIEKEQAEFQVGIELNIRDLASTLQNAQNLGTRDPQTQIGRQNLRTTSHFIQGAVSPGGTGLIFKQTKNSNIDGQTLHYYSTEIKGTENNQIVATVITLPGKRTKGNITKIALIPSLIRSLIDTNPTKTLLFVLVPQNKSIDLIKDDINRHIISDKQNIHSLILIKEAPILFTFETNKWTLANGKDLPNSNSLTAEITHPALHDTPITGNTTDSQLQVTLKATSQLKEIVTKLAN